MKGHFDAGRFGKALRGIVGKTLRCETHRVAEEGNSPEPAKTWQNA
jgi:hypothetical protein